jgi:prepilin-type N-terminal cleavage/methylation domain-containing protein
MRYYRAQFERWRSGFTLIELLIVVAIISILAAIAVPNLLLAQSRAKTARAAADQRALATALETYAVDNAGRYPAYGNPRDRALFAGEPVVFVPVSLSTPMAYMASLPPDVFPGRRTGIDNDFDDTYFYMNDYGVTYLGKNQAEGHVALHYLNLTGQVRPVKWTLWSYGPNLKDEHGIVMYDASNGVVSRGDLMRFGP